MSAWPHKSVLRSTQTRYAEMLKTGKLLIFSFFMSQGHEGHGFNRPSLCHHTQLWCFTHGSLLQLIKNGMALIRLHRAPVARQQPVVTDPCEIPMSDQYTLCVWLVLVMILKMCLQGTPVEWHIRLRVLTEKMTFFGGVCNCDCVISPYSIEHNKCWFQLYVLNSLMTHST